MNLNKVFIIGRITADIQLRTTPSGQSVTTFSVATNRSWTGKTGNREEEVEFHTVVAWGRTAEIASQFLTKGSLVMIEGRLRTRSWQDKQGQTRRVTEIISERLQLGPRSASTASAKEAPQGVAGMPKMANPVSSPKASAPAEEVPPLEELPVIDLEAEEVKPEDLPF